MKLLKLTMLAATAAVAASAFIGASSASAVTTHRWIALCDAQQLLLCETNHLIKHPLLGRLLLLKGAGEFNAGFVTIKCTSGHGETNAVESQQEQEPGNSNTLPNKAFLANLQFLTLTGCTGCTTIATTTPQTMHLWMQTELGEDWRFTLNGYTLKFSGCPFGVSCTYKGNLVFNVKMDAEGAFFDPEGKELSLSEGSGLCASTGKWTSGRTRLDWKLDDANSSIHTHVWPTLLENLTLHTGVEL
jgi:hypothetical protein